MGILDLAKQDWKDLSSNTDSGFGVALSFEAPTGETADVAGLRTKHHLKVDTDGAAVNSKTIYVSVSEKLLTDLDYPVRNNAKEVDLKNHLVTLKDSTGESSTYIVREWFPDETIGVILMLLNDYLEE